MATMISEVYQAFITAGVPQDQARQAAEALSAENLATKADIQLLDKRIDNVQAQITLLKWMAGFNLAFTMAILWKIIS
jgi:polyhydroxyalkanoate synthesis regulator phasin